MSEGSPTEQFGPYVVYEQLGVGGMAQVHRAIARTSGVQRRPIALKRMLSHMAGSEEMVKSFVREARLARYLRHENVAQTYDLGRVGNIYFIVMELITGRNLREVLRHCAKTTGPMPVQVALNILNQICDALHYAHNLCDETGKPLGIIHRDVSPSNVIVSDSGVVKLIDFGIAKVSSAATQTIGGTLKGKFAYMAPEYLDGQLDARADLFAVGVIAHELLTNRPLFSVRDDIDTLRRVRDMHIDPPSKNNPLVPPEIDDIVMTALARDPERRWQHATALRTALTTLTRRLHLVASNKQVVQWLDWAFTHLPVQDTPVEPHTEIETQTETRPDTRPNTRPDTRPNTRPDTRPDIELVTDDPSISIEPCTVNLTATSQNTTLVMRDDDPEPPTKTPVGTPACLPAQPSAVAKLSNGTAQVTVADRHRRDTGLAPRATANAVVPSTARPSGARRAHARPSSPIPLPLAISAPASLIPAPVPRPAPAPPPAPPPAAAPAPELPSFDAAPMATPHPPMRSPAALLDDSPQSEAVQRDFAQPVSPPSTEVAAPARRSRVPVVVLVVLAAAIAAITVYFLLPLLT